MSSRRRYSQRSSHLTFADLHVGSHSEDWSTKLSVVSAPQKGASCLFSAQLLDHRFTKCCLFWLLTTVGLRFFDVSRAFRYTPIKTPVFAVPPEEYQSPIPGGVWEMTKTVYGLEEAPADFDEHFGKEAADLCDESGSLGLARLTAEPPAFHSKFTSVMMQTNGRWCIGWSR